MAYEGNLKNTKLNVKKYIMQINKISDHFEIIKLIKTATHREGVHLYANTGNMKCYHLTPKKSG